ncbi:hypothetical protein FNV62_36365 [Streptomyces sp. RLB3-17]|uniref:hypothetical protein n=1 Tax=Streptomyces sp. RLB3-17 TaxID=2594455 RepID=UPI0011631116|nr:hypothetical protein [Streptomyces sp. RLB3-17]QDO42885.1 hypothetical protein FNV62_36365 [Streptomyces sp. RLB3-17]
MSVFIMFTLIVITPLVLTMSFILIRGSLKAKDPAQYAIDVLKRIPALIRVLWDGLRTLGR